MNYLGVIFVDSSLKKYHSGGHHAMLGQVCKCENQARFLYNISIFQHILSYYSHIQKSCGLSLNLIIISKNPTTITEK